MIRLGLCCLFIDQPIKFRVATATHLLKFPRNERLAKLSWLCLENARTLLKAIEYCGAHHIGCFRVNSQFWPVKTHPDAGYDLAQLPDETDIQKMLLQCRERSRALDVRLSFHPDQFILLSSPKPDVVQRSILELEYQAQVSALIGADVINIHAGGGYGNKQAALKRMGRVLPHLSKDVRSRLTLENDDRIYSPADLLPFCKQYQVPLVYDVHHHRCLPDGLTVQEATDAALKTWDREPLFHISSPKQGWDGKHVAWHHDYIHKSDFPVEWQRMNITVEVEAKAKELAVRRLYHDLKFSKMVSG
ncbi:MAG: UV DNA damage repair endonuclease UvsE [Candidatus Omnitrophica bacterium]|nr:UV DNA damage repair endonuclease UvsE [Candidatus Omnitrophota bacterium]